MASQLFVPGPAQIYVGTKGKLSTRLVFAGGGGGGACGTVTVDGNGGIATATVIESLNGYTSEPNAIFVGGGLGAHGKGSISDGKVTAVTSRTGYLNVTSQFGASGVSYIDHGQSNLWGGTGGGWEFLGFAKEGIRANPVTAYAPFMADYTGDIPISGGYSGKSASIEIALNRYQEDVLERAIRQCSAGCPGSTGGFVDGTATDSTTFRMNFRNIGASFLQELMFVPLAIVSPYVTAKSTKYGGLPKGIHFPCATISAESCLYSVRPRTVAIAFQCHWVPCRITCSGILYDYNVKQCIDLGPS